MPIRASTLRRPASSAVEHVGTPPRRRQLLGAAAASLLAQPARRASRGWTTRAPAATTIARAWTSRASPASSDEIAAAAQAGLGERGVDGPRREDRRHGEAPLVEVGGGVGQTTTSAPSRAASRASVPRRSSAASRPSGPAAAGQVASSVRTARCGARERTRTASSRPSRSTTNGRATRTVGGARRQPAEQRRPAAELHLEVHDRSLALRVDRRVGDLRERLAEVVGDRAGRRGRDRRAACRRPCSTAARGRRGPWCGRRGAAARRRARTGNAAPGSWRRDRARRPRQSMARSPDPDRAVAVGEDLARGVVEGQASEDPRLGVGVRRGRARPPDPPGAARRAPGGRVRTISPGESGTAPASDATATTPVGGQRPGGRPEAVAVEQRADPPAVAEHERAGAVPRRDEPGHPPAERGDGRVRRAAEARWPRGRARAGRSRATSRSRPAAPAPRRGTASRDAVGESRGPAARSRSAAARRRLGMPASSRRPRTASRFPRTVLISPLCATNANGCASDQTGDVLVAYRWWNIANGTSIGAPRSGNSWASRPPATRPL